MRFLRRSMPVALILALVPLALPAQEDGDLAPAKPSGHEWLKPWAGTWDTRDKARSSPEAAYTETAGVHTIRLDLNGFWLVSDLQTTLFGMPYKAHMQIGYDPRRNVFVGTVINSLTPELTLLEGSLDDAKKVLTMTYDAFHPVSGKPQKQKAVWEVKDANSVALRFSMPAADGKDFVFLEKLYTRRK